MAQNRSNAVMATRIEAKDSLDFFPTPAWATRALCEWLGDIAGEPPLGSQCAWEPACGEGHMARPLGEYFGQVLASDVHDHGYGAVSDFLSSAPALEVDWIITNPPFRLAKSFARKARPEASRGVALLVRTAFLEGGSSPIGRYHGLFKVMPPTDILQFSERVPMFQGRIDRHGSTATAYCWIVWRRSPMIGQFHWLPPCRRRLERDSDYPEVAA